MSDETISTLEAAQEYIRRHDTDAVDLDKMSKKALALVEVNEMNTRGITHLLGGPQTKDELIRSILEMRFPLIRQAYEVHAAGVNAQQHEQAVNELAMRLGTIQDENLAEVLSRAHPAARQRLHEMTSVYAPAAARYLDWPVRFIHDPIGGHSYAACWALRPGRIGGQGKQPTLCLERLGEAESPRQLLELIRRHDQTVKHSDPAYEAQ